MMRFNIKLNNFFSIFCYKCKNGAFLSIKFNMNYLLAKFV